MITSITILPIVALASFAICLKRNWISEKLGIIDHPDADGGRKRHAAPTPLIGGLAILIPLLVVMLGMPLIMPEAPAAQLGLLPAMALATVAMTVTGLFDDRKHIPAVKRLLVSIVVFSCMLLLESGFILNQILLSPIDQNLALGAFAIPFTLVCLIGLKNAINMADGKNGLVISLCLLWSLLLYWHAPVGLRPLLAAMVFALVPVLCFNMRGKLFLGDNGSYGLATLLGLLTIHIYNLPGSHLTVWEVITMYAFPVLDTLRLMVSRIMQHRSPFDGGRDHLHHFLHHSHDWPRGLFVYILSAAPPMLGIAFFPHLGPLWAASALLAYVVLVMRYRIKYPSKADHSR